MISVVGHVPDQPPEQGVMVEATSLESLPPREPLGDDINNSSSHSEDHLSSTATPLLHGGATGDSATTDNTLSSPARQQLSKSSSQSAASLLNPKVATVSSSRRSSQSSLSSRRLKVQSPPKMEPQYNLIIKVGGICALPNIQAKEISVRASINNVKLEEVEIAAESASGNNSQRQTPRHRKVEKVESTIAEVIPPKVKARIIIGDKVKELFPEDASDLDIVLIGKASDLDVSLLLPNALVMKDFFDDEYEADNPVPMHLRIENTRVVLMEEASHGPDHVKTMRIAVDRTDIHRGRKLREEVDVFLERGREVMGRAVSTETLHDEEENAINEGEMELIESDDGSSGGGGGMGKVEIDVQLSQQGQVELTESFNSFLKELEHYLSRDGRQNNREQVVRVLEQIRTRSLESSDNDNTKSTGRDTNTGRRSVRQGTGGNAPTTRFDFDTLSTFFVSYHQSKLSSASASSSLSSPPAAHGHPVPPPLSSTPHQASPPPPFTAAGIATSNQEELMRLRRENERLRQQGAQFQKENAQLLESKESMVKQLSDFDMVTEECKSVKEQLVAYKQVMEKQHEQMEGLLNDNTELQRKLALQASGRLNS